MADRSISVLTAATVLNSSDLFVLSQNNQAKSATWQLIISYLTTALDGHGGINSISYTPPEEGSLEGALTITLADGTSETFVVTNGKAIDSIQDYWAVSSSNSTEPSTWYTSLQTMTPTNKYLWHYQTITFNDESTLDTDAAVVGVYGDTGQSWYVYIKYASEEPTQDSDMGNIPDDWIGIYSGTEADDSNLHYTDYAWFEFKGEKGDTGEDAAIDNQSVEYAQGDYGNIIPSGGWSTTIPEVAQGKFLWTRTTVVYSDANQTTVVSYSVARMGLDGVGSECLDTGSAGE